MSTQVYFHDVRRVDDLHLKDFLQAWLKGEKFPADWRELMGHTDHKIRSDLWEAAAEPGDALHDLAKRLVSRQHFRSVWTARHGDAGRAARHPGISEIARPPADQTCSGTTKGLR